MSATENLEIKSDGPDHTFTVGESMGKNLKGNECIELVSDLGGGKTLFVRGLAKGAGSRDQVASPSFTVSRIYKTDHFNIDHYDLYRLEEAGVVGSEVEESLLDEKTVTVIEWGGVVEDILPRDRLRLHIGVKDSNTRILEISAGPNHKHLLNKLK